MSTGTNVSRKYGLTTNRGGNVAATKKKKVYGSYNLKAEGELRTTPAMQDIPQGYKKNNKDEDFTIVAYDDTTGDVQVINGELTVVEDEATVIRPRDLTDAFGDQHFSQTIETIVDAAKSQGCVVNGSIRVLDNENQKRWRIRVDNGVCIYEEPMLVWPDGTKDTL